MTLTPSQRTEEAEVVRLTREEWQADIDAHLARLGLTLEELKEQAREDVFDSHDAKIVWMYFHATQ
ncbi:hypothetical protein [Symbioplanes lichenis]|uniref:hypothetical protein n=1 Tax=Symbioplanes lichenis TaxID=1629072 RepID=UPI0027399C84|nr:hypothetical protein [Actinoplanes lichenis]